MEEIFEIVKAVNKLKEGIKDLGSKIEILSKTPALQVPPEYLDEKAVCKILHINQRALRKIRSNKSIHFYKSGHNHLYLRSDIQQYLDQHCRS